VTKNKNYFGIQCYWRTIPDLLILLFPYDRLVKKIAALGVASRVVEWVSEFLLGRSRTDKVGGQIS
jgi:hypothetical protein